MKKPAFKKVMLCGLIVSMLLSSSGCGGGNNDKEYDKGSGEMPKTLTIFSGLGSYALKAGAKDNNDLLPYQLMEELTGCHVEWIHPAVGGMEEKFNLMIASGNLPDMIVYYWREVSGGAKMYADDDIILPLSGMIKENMPNLSTFNEANPAIAKQYYDDSGEVYSIPFIRKDSELKVFQGPQIRKDWLDKLGLEMPKTPDELYDVLKAFKTRDPNGNGIADEIPMSGVKFEGTPQAISNLMWQFGTANGFYIEDGKVKYGVMEDKFATALSYITKLYSEGLIDHDYLINDRDKMDNKFMNDKVGFVYSLQPSKYYSNMNDGTRVVAGVPHLSSAESINNCFDATYLQDVTQVSIAVTTSNSNPSGSLKWLDNFFGGEGYEYMNFGKEGLTFNYENGYPRLTDYILNNPDGKSTQEMCGLNLGNYESCFPSLQDWRYYEQILTDWGKNAIKTWNESAKIDGIIPELSFTEKENEIIARDMSQILTFVSERVNKIVIGNSSIDDLDEIRNSIKKMGIDEVIGVYNDALVRYNNR